MKNILLLFALILTACSNGERPNKIRKMETVGYSVNINASPETVYNTMIDKEGFKKWVAVFGANAFYEGSWEKGRKMIYKSPDEKGQMQGMISTIKENIPYKEIYIQPIGILENGMEIYSGEKVKDLNKSFENYLFIDNGDGTMTLKVNVAIYEELKDYFNTTWPKALKVIKEISEQK